MSFDDQSGTGLDNQPGTHLGADRWNERSNSHNNERTETNSEPSFDPSQLNEFVDTNYELIPLHGPNDLDAKGRSIGKAPLMGWRKPGALLTIDEAAERFASGRNVGVRLSATDLVLDVDQRNFPEGRNTLYELGKELKVEWHQWPCVMTGSGGFHYYMKKAEGIRTRETLDDYPGLEFKTLGRQMVSAGSVHPETGKTYKWDPIGIPLDAISDAPSQLLDLLERPNVQHSNAVGGEIAPEELEQMLEGLDVTDFSSNASWEPIMMACHHATSGAGIEEFFTWSIGDPAYADDGWLIRNRWDSLHSSPDRRQITERTLFKALHKAGNGHLIPKQGAVDDFAEGSDFQREAGSHSPSDALEVVNSQYFTVLTAGKYLVGRERPSPYSGFMQVEWYPDEAVRKYLDNRFVAEANDNGEGKRKPMGSWWIKHPARRQYEGVIFDPSPTAAHQDLYNLWRGWSVEPKEGDWSLMKRLLKDVLCGGNQDSYEYVLKWSAFMVQHPNLAAEVAVVFKGTKGIGKGTFARSLMQLAGLHGLQVAQAEHFTGRFNEHLSDKIFLFVDEGMWGGDKKLEGAVKNLITEPVLTFEGKNKPVVTGPNRLHIMIASNEDWVVPASNDERRFAIFEANHEAHAGLPKNFFGKLHSQMRNGGQAAMLYELLNMDLGNWHPRQDVPVTAALVDQKLEGLRSDPIAFWWYRKLEDGELNFLDIGNDWSAGPLVVASREKDALIYDLGATAKAMGKRQEFTKTKLARRFREFGIDVDGRDAENGRFWSIPSLAEARANFEAWLGGDVEWSDNI